MVSVLDKLSLKYPWDIEAEISSRQLDNKKEAQRRGATEKRFLDSVWILFLCTPLHLKKNLLIPV